MVKTGIQGRINKKDSRVDPLPPTSTPTGD